MVSPLIVLFDIDGTLIDCGGAGRRALDRAFERHFGVTNACRAIRFGGMTDHAILREAFAPLGVEYTRSLADEVLETYLVELERELSAGGFRVLPHAHAIVRRTGALGHACGVGTGNVRGGAEAKLRRAELGDAFAFGGFGCDAEARADVLAAAVIRARAEPRYADAPVLVIGDTPKDVAAAHAIGARCVGVTTGSFDVDALLAAGADWVAPSLADPLVEGLLENQHLPSDGATR